MKNDPKETQIQAMHYAKCSELNQAHFVCFSQTCSAKSFTCQNQNCQCHQTHKFCFKLTVKNVQQIVVANSNPFRQIQQKISDIFDKVIDKLSDERQKLLTKYKDQFNFLGLTKMQKKFINALQSGNDDGEITCQFVWDHIVGHKKQNRAKQLFAQMERDMNRIKQSFDRKIDKFAGLFTKVLQQMAHGQDEGFLMKSKIIKSIEDQNKVLAFFTNKKVDSGKLLYRASENQFLTSKFYEKCSHAQNTLTIVETEYGKIIGGFTQFAWYKPQSGQWIPAIDNQKEHFLFSVTNNDKFTITQNFHYCIFLDSGDNYGPLFGLSACSNDLRICNKANENNNSYAQPGHTFTNPNYKLGDAASYTKFAGGSNFKIKEWEVWQISFKQYE